MVTLFHSHPLVSLVKPSGNNNSCINTSPPSYKTRIKPIGVDFFAKAGPITDIDLLITDEEASIEAIEGIESKGVKVVIAKINE